MDSVGTHYRGGAAEVRALDALIKLVRCTSSLQTRLEVGLREAGFTPTQFGVLEAILHLRRKSGCQSLRVRSMVEAMLVSYLDQLRLAANDAGVDLKQAVLAAGKRDIALDALRRYCEPWVRFRVPGGGIYFWLELSPQVDWDQVRERAVADGVACRPGERFTGDGSGKGYLRLSFLHVSEEEIERGISVLGKALSASVIA